MQLGYVTYSVHCKTAIFRHCYCVLQFDTCPEFKHWKSTITDVSAFLVFVVLQLGNTALHMACMSGTLPVVQQLISLGAALNEYNRRDLLTPLHLACARKHVDVAEVILQAGAQVDLIDKVLKGQDGRLGSQIRSRGWWKI